MGNPYGKILTGAGLISGGALTKAAKDKYVDEVVALLLTGNADGKGGSPSTKIFNSLFPLPPLAGPPIPNVTTLSVEPLFWFGTDPAAALIATQLKDPKNNPFWHMIFPDLLYEKTAVAMDIAGGTPLFPILDYSAVFDIDLPFPITIPDLALKVNVMPPPALLIKLLAIPLIPIPPLPPIPPIPPSIPFPDFGFSLPSLALPDLLLGLIKLPFDLVIKLMVPSLNIVLDLPNLPKLVLGLALDIVVNLLISLGLLLIVPKVFVASLLIYIKNVVAMVCTDVVGLIVGAGGSMTKLIAGLTGLV